MRSSNHDRKREPQQRLLEFPRHGGPRKGAGRKPKGAVAGPSHDARPSSAERHPLLVTQRMCAGLPSLRKPEEFEILRVVFEEALEREDFRIVHFSVQTNQVHYICEARDKQSLTRGMQSLGVKIARRLNQLWERAGRVFAERYHARALETPHEVRTALAYVLNNARKHGLGFVGADPYLSGPSFDGWSGESAPFSNAPRDRGRVSSSDVPTTAPCFTRTVDCPIATAQTWLMRVGWRRHGLIHVHEIPGAGSATRTRLEAQARLVDSIRRSSTAAAREALGRVRLPRAMEARS